MEKVKVIIVDKQQKVKVPSGTRLLVRKCCNAVLKSEGFESNAEININFVDNEQIKEINKEFRNIDAETDVLSFPLSDNDKYDINPETGFAMIGDIVLSLEKAESQAEVYHHSFQREIAFLTVHSMFHLLGYDHVNGGMEERIMREKEESVLNKLGLARDLSFTSNE